MVALCTAPPGSPPDRLSPCRCIGTQRYVHEHCLRKWQAACHDDRAYHCSVCKARFKVQPEGQWSHRLLQLAKSLSTIACIALLVFGLTGPPWPHVAAVGLLLLGTRASSVLSVVLLSLVSDLEGASRCSAKRWPPGMPSRCCGNPTSRTSAGPVALCNVQQGPSADHASRGAGAGAGAHPPGCICPRARPGHPASLLEPAGRRLLPAVGPAGARARQWPGRPRCPVEPAC